MDDRHHPLRDVRTDGFVEALERTFPTLAVCVDVVDEERGITWIKLYRGDFETIPYDRIVLHTHASVVRLVAWVIADGVRFEQSVYFDVAGKVLPYLRQLTSYHTLLGTLHG